MLLGCTLCRKEKRSKKGRASVKKLGDFYLMCMSLEKKWKSPCHPVPCSSDMPPQMRLWCIPRVPSPQTRPSVPRTWHTVPRAEATGASTSPSVPVGKNKACAKHTNWQRKETAASWISTNCYLIRVKRQMQTQLQLLPMHWQGDDSH